MTESDIKALFLNYRCYEMEINMLTECYGDGNLEQYSYIMRRMALVSHWLTFVPEKSRHVLKRHLIDGVSWAALSEENRMQDRLPCDERSLQRIQNKAIRAIYDFMSERFGDALDYLSEAHNASQQKSPQICRQNAAEMPPL